MADLQIESRLSDFQTSVPNMKPHFFKRLCFGTWHKGTCLTSKFLFTGNYIQSIKTLGFGRFAAGNLLPIWSDMPLFGHLGVPLN